ncbi:MAG: PorT family protein [Muribaculaceae bacterium]|nr:PorT family protein [Muribaculaceae bacterium]MDE6008575.1 PorT family protein [Muribaculaceae bacterium]MDE6792036.1 PorT family protein [Muribaculaceae bacterium]
MKRFLRHIISLRLLAISALLFVSGVSMFLDAKPQDKLMNRPYADLKRWHLGFSIGMHVQDISFTHNGIVSDDGQRWVAEVPNFSPGFCVNVLGALRLHKYLELRFTPGMYFGSKGVVMRDYDSDLSLKQDVKSAYVTLPLDLKISGDRMRNARPYLSAGTMFAFDISKKRRETLLFNTSDAFLCVGLGVDFYLPFFKLNPELKFCFGLTDILKHDRPDLADDPESFKMTAALKKAKQNMVVLTFYFE